VAMLAGVLADSFWYYLGYFGREQVIARWGRYINVDLATIGKMERVLFGEQANRVIFSAKLTSALIIPTLIAAGLAKMGWRRVMRAMVMAQVLWTLGLTVVGFIAADSFMLISRKVEHFGWLAGGAIALLFAGRIVYRWRKYR
ncbi:MAG: DedA family protein, partial [Anaerolineae bacterium]